MVLSSPVISCKTGDNRNAQLCFPRFGADSSSGYRAGIKNDIRLGSTFYAATKTAASTLTRRFAMELRVHVITVNAMAPGFILSDMMKEGRTEQEYQAARPSSSAPGAAVHHSTKIDGN